MISLTIGEMWFLCVTLFMVGASLASLVWYLYVERKVDRWK